MDRRAALGLLAGGALAPGMAFAAGRPPRVVVIGAGIMGTSIAYHLARQGAHVTVLDKAAPGSGATQGAFAMLIATHEGDRAFNDLYGLAVGDWHRLQAELAGALPIQWGGTCSWAAPGPAADSLRALTYQLRGWGAPIRLMSEADLQSLAPGVISAPFGAGTYSPEQGTLDPSEAHAAIEAAARRLGVAFRYPCEVKALKSDGHRITALQTTTGPVEADVFVLAAGAAVPDLAQQVGVKTPINVVSGTLAHSAPRPPLLGRVLNGPAGSLKQDPDGRIVFGPDYRPGANGTDVSQAYGEQLLTQAAAVFPPFAGAKLEKMTLGYVPIPVDNHPIVGFCAAPANLYVALTMSGITMSPLMGRLAAGEILGGAAQPALATYRPARFT
ncbi:MAG TPA: FAD-binding oxidoreductase [Caulobacteraceae bacterium]|nr:FAD-binding oxidoreductase [Caulobacteraceae bacterium]